MPKVSIILPNYNHASFLAQRLRSIEQQTFTDYELIMLDDNSSDNSQQILREYAATRPEVRCIFNEKNSGSPFAQWNRGAALARGEYLWIAESDDYADPGLLEKLSAMLDAKPAAGIAYVQSVLVDEKGQTISSYRKNLEFIYPQVDWQKEQYIAGHTACRELLIFHNPIPNASGALMRRSVYEAAGGADAGMKLNGDWYVYARMLARSDLYFHPAELNFFRVHASTQRQRSRATYKVYDEIIEINNFIRSDIPASAENADKALRKVGRWWTGSLPYQKDRRKNFRANWRLYRFFRPHLSHLWLRICYNFLVVNVRNLLIWLHLLEPVKELRNRLFPGKYFQQ